MVGAVILVCAKKDIRPHQSFKRQLELMIVRISLELRPSATIGRLPFLRVGIILIILINKT